MKSAILLALLSASCVSFANPAPFALPQVTESGDEQREQEPPIREGKVTVYISQIQFKQTEEGYFEEVSEPLCVREGRLPIFDQRKGQEVLMPPSLLETCELTTETGRVIVTPFAIGMLMIIDGAEDGFDIKEEAVAYFGGVSVSKEKAGGSEYYDNAFGAVATAQLENNRLWLIAQPENVAYKSCQADNSACDLDRVFFRAMVKVEDVQN